MTADKKTPQTPLSELNGTTQKEWADEFLEGYKALQKKVAAAFEAPAETIEMNSPPNGFLTQETNLYQTMSGHVAATYGQALKPSELQSGPKTHMSDVVLPDGSSALSAGLPTQEQAIKTGVKIGTESIGTDAWDIYKMPNGSMMRVTAYPPVNAGKVYDYSVSPPLYNAPYMQRKVSQAEQKLFSDISIDPQQAVARVEVAKMRLEQREAREREAKQNARRILQDELEGWQQAQMAQTGFFDIVSLTGSRFRVNPKEPWIAYKLDGYDRPVGVVRLRQDGRFFDEQTRHILSLRTGTLTSDATFSHYKESQAPWPILPPVPGQEAAGRIASLEFA